MILYICDKFAIKHLLQLVKNHRSICFELVVLSHGDYDTKNLFAKTFWTKKIILHYCNICHTYFHHVTKIYFKFKLISELNICSLRNKICSLAHFYLIILLTQNRYNMIFNKLTPFNFLFPYKQSLLATNFEKILVYI